MVLLDVFSSTLDISWIKENVPFAENVKDVVKDIPVVPAVVGLGAATVIGGYALLNSKYQKWKKLGIDGPEPILYFGNMLPRFTLSQGTVPEYEVKLFQKYGKRYGFYEMSLPVLVVAEPDILKNIFVRDFTAFMDRRDRATTKIGRHFLTALKGEEWRRARNTITPSFTSGKMKVMLSLMDECALTLTNIFDQKAQSGENVDIKSVYGCYTMDVVAKCAFATETNAQTDGKNSVFVNHALAMFSPPKWRILAMFLLPKFVLPYIADHEHIDFLESTVKSILAERKKQEYTRHYKDFLQVLTESLKEDLPNGNSVPDAEAHHGHENGDHLPNGFVANDRKRNLTEDEVVANSIIFLLAGYETTATLLTYCSYALAVNPDVQEKLREECQEAFEASGNKIDYEVVSTLKYLDSTICETLRMYPPVLRVDRTVTENYKMEFSDGKVVKLVPGDLVRIPIYAMHHCDEFYPDHDKFQPERFMPENRDKLVPYTYLPFGAGPRNCIGMRFALLEAKLAIMRLLLRYRFVKSDKTPATPDLSKAQLLMGAKDMYVKVERL